MKSFVVLLILLAFCWATVALHDLRYYEAKITITNDTTNEMAGSGPIPAGVYATIATPCDLTGCEVKSFRQDCNELVKDLTIPCYPIECNNGAPPCDQFVAGSAAPVTRNTPPDGIIVPARDIKLQIKRLAVRTAATDRITFPVIVVHSKIAFLLSTAGLVFSVLVGDEQSISSHSVPVATEPPDSHTEQSENDYKKPLYYATLFVVLPMLIFIILIFLATIGLCVIWMCRECTIKIRLYVYRKWRIKSYIKVVVNAEEEDNATSHCCICLEEYKPNDVMGVLPCMHEYHKPCISKWLIKHTTCPLCKSDILLDKHEVVTDCETSSPAAEVVLPRAPSTEVVEINFESTEITEL